MAAGVRVKGIAATQARLERTGERTTKAALAELRAGAEKVVKTAQDNAPFKTGDLEKAIVAEESRTGTNRRTVIEVKVDPSTFDHPHGADYFVRLHEDPSWNPGPLSRQKIAEGKRVGPKYITRAVEAHRREIATRVRYAVERSLKL